MQKSSLPNDPSTIIISPELFLPEFPLSSTGKAVDTIFVTTKNQSRADGN